MNALRAPPDHSRTRNDASFVAQQLPKRGSIELDKLFLFLSGEDITQPIHLAVFKQRESRSPSRSRQICWKSVSIKICRSSCWRLLSSKFSRRRAYETVFVTLFSFSFGFYSFFAIVSFDIKKQKGKKREE